MSDLISKKKTIEAIREFQAQVTCEFSQDWENGMNEGFDHSVGVIELMDTVETPQWIPVSERLPEDSYETDLIVTLANGMVKFACFTKGDGFVSLTGFCQLHEVVAWMLKPEPYRGE